MSILILPGSCDCCFEPCYTEPPPVIPESGGEEEAPSPTFLESAEVGPIEVIPGVIHAEAETSFLLQARIRNAQGQVVADPTLAVKWEASWPVGWIGELGGGPITFYPNPGNPTVLKLPTFPRLADGGTSPSTVTIDNLVAKIGAVPSPPAKVHVHRPGGDTSKDQLVVNHTAGDPPTAVLLDARIGNGCRQDMLLSVVKRAQFEPDLMDGCLPGGPEAAFFSASHSALLVDPNWSETDEIAGIPGGLWATGLGDIVSKTLQPRITVKVELRAGVQIDNSAILAEMRTDLARAQAVFDSSGVGVLFQESGAVDLGQPIEFDQFKCTDDASGDSDLVSTLGAGASLSNPVIHVLYANSITGVGWGRACLWTSTRKFAIAAIEYDKKDPETLTHELAHLMGNNSRALISSGHIDNWRGFECWNIMQPYADFACLENRNHLSIGQVYRANFDERSWLTLIGKPPPFKCCQCDPYQNALCPVLSQDVGTVTTLGTVQGCEPTATCTVPGGGS